MIITREKLIEAFKKWNRDYAKNPTQFDDTISITEKSIQQAETLIEYLEN
jgi:hypothetical protein